MKTAPLFWPISREQHHITDINRFRSLITYQILFGGRLLIRDGDYLNSLILRGSMIQALTGANDDNARFFRTLLDERYVMIVRREENTLAELAERYGRPGQGGPPVIRQEWFRPEAADVVYLESDRFSADQSIRYSVKEAAAYYTQQIQAMLSRDLEPYVNERFRHRAVERVAALVEQHRTLAWSFFYSDGVFWEAFTEKERQEHLPFFDLVLGQAPHAGFIPDTLRLNPIYMQDIARAVALWRGTLRREGELVDSCTIELGAGFSFSDYIEYLCLLPFDTLVHLMNSEENAAFRRACRLFSLQKVSLKEVERTYRNYRRMIDSELLKLHLVRPQAGPKTNLRAFVLAARDDLVDEGVQIVCDELIGTTIPFWRLGLALFYRVMRGEWPEQRKTRLIKEADATEIAEEIQRLQSNSSGKLGGHVSFAAPGTQERIIKLEPTESEADVCVTLPEHSSPRS